MFLDNGCVSLYTITRSLAFWIQAARYYTICIILYHVHHQNRCYVATLIAIPIFFTLTYIQIQTIDYSLHKQLTFRLIDCKIYESRMKWVSKEESSCDNMSGVKLQSLNCGDSWPAIDLPFCWWHFEFKLTWSKFLDDDVSNLAKLVTCDVRIPNYLLGFYGLPIWRLALPSLPRPQFPIFLKKMTGQDGVVMMRYVPRWW